MRQIQWMTKWNEFAGPLGGLDAGQSRGVEHIAFGNPVGLDKTQRGRLKSNRAAGDGFAQLDGFGGHVHHLRFAAGVDVGEFHPPMTTILRPGT